MLTSRAGILLALVVSVCVVRSSHAFLVNSTGDEPDANPGNGTCATAAFKCTLRAAIQEANATVDPNVQVPITFNTAGGPLSIDVPSQLDTISHYVAITADGNYQVELTTSHGVPTGLVFGNGSQNSYMQYLVVNRFETGILINTDNVSIYPSRIGTSSDGMTALGNSAVGIQVNGSGCAVRGSQVSGNGTGTGIVINGSNNLVDGGNVGLNASATAALPNATGIRIETGISNQITYASYGYPVIAGNTGDGVRIASSAQDSLIRYAIIGMNSSFTTFPNGGSAIAVEPSSKGNKFRQVNIHGNGGLGIDLLEQGNAPGVTLNDVTDADVGANGRQNFPIGPNGVSTKLILLPDRAGVQAALQSAPNKTYSVQLYQSPTCDPCGYGEGRNPIGPVKDVLTDSNGYVEFGFDLAGTPVNLGWVVTATAESADGTSEFSECASEFGVTTTTAPGTCIYSQSTTSSSTTTSSTTSSSTTTSTTAAPSTTTSSPGPTTSTTSTSAPTTTSVTTMTAPTSTSTISTTSSTLPTTSSTSTLATTTTTSTTFSQPSTSTTTSTTTSTLKRCGNGVVDAGEACDPNNPEFRGCCDQIFCVPLQDNQECGLDDDQCGIKVCDQGRCKVQPANRDGRKQCRKPGDLGSCDPGAFCDDFGCPANDIESACEAINFSYSSTKGRLKFRCQAKRAKGQDPNAPLQGPLNCGGAVLEMSLPTAGAVLDSAPIVRSANARRAIATQVNGCTGAQYAVTLAKKMRKTGPEDLFRMIVEQIPKGIRSQLTPGATVCVRVTFTDNQGFLKTRNYLVVIPAS